MPGKMPDWLVVYTEGNAFRFDKLIDDDYFAAIKLLFNARHIASTSKLLMSCVDTLAFVEFGDKRGNFVEWLTTYTGRRRTLQARRDTARENLVKAGGEIEACAV